ncbi:MAG TPA: ATP-binding cassette domain-containing protein, partial [Candidatus Eisenbacteria bacterium]|nr:ATP-binding cassette domain-containing protein [Candidatus Eisenbacteria bacterium]
MAPAPVIQVKHLSFRRNGRPVLHDVSFEIEEGELVGLIGPNGGGKTSLLQTLLGVLGPYEGEIRILGREPGHLDQARGQIGYVAQTKQFDRDFPARAK